MASDAALSRYIALMDNRASISILLTGFGPFPGAAINPSALLVQRLARLRRPALAGMQVATHIFQTSYAAIDRELPALIEKHAPDIILMFGLAARSHRLRIETLAQNRTSFFADATGTAPRGRAIGPGAPVKRNPQQLSLRLLRAARTRGAKAYLSRDAGRYVCNYAYWRGLEATQAPGGPSLVAFIHIPKVQPRDQPHRTQSHRLPDIDALTLAAADILAAAVAHFHTSASAHIGAISRPSTQASA